MTSVDNTLKSIVSDKEQLIANLLGQLAATQTTMEGLDKAIPTLLTNESEANTRKMLNTTMKLVRKQQELNQVLISVVIMLASSRNFTGWQGELAVKLGSDPGEVLRKMFRDKMEGRS